jgi:DNA-binding beta-propeller fold protein YncE
VGAYPTGVGVVMHTNHVYTANQLGGSVSFVDGTAFSLRGSLDVGATPTDAEANFRTGRVFVSNQDSATVSVIQDG